MSQGSPDIRRKITSHTSSRNAKGDCFNIRKWVKAQEGRGTEEDSLTSDPLCSPSETGPRETVLKRPV